LARSDRDVNVSNVTLADKKVSDGYGGLTPGTPATVVTGYAFSWWPMRGVFGREQVIARYGLTTNADLKQLSGEYNSAIADGQYITVDGASHRILAARPVNGRSGTPVRLAMLAVKVAA
jgi:hypothetical protein